jgi:4-hydroxy-tetrahydrodipicolinate synthase
MPVTANRDKLISGMEPAIFTGLGTAIITPFHRDESVDHASLKKLVEAQIAGGVDFLVACGTTGETSTLSEDETDAVIATVIAAANGRIPVIAGCTHNSTREAVRRATHIAKVAGLSGILSANPYYNKPTQQGQYLHFKAIADAIAPMPLVLYNIPGRTAANCEPATLLRLAELSNVVGVKESSGNLAQIGELLANAPASFKVFSGDDYLALPIIAGGGVGLISVASNVAPKLVAEMTHAAVSGDADAARECAKAMHALNTVLFVEPNPAPTKALLAMMGVIESETLRLPMIPVSDATRATIRAVAAALHLL